ncbi:MAG: tRNA (cytidine(34)-2'-O)-methyltransferase [Helicobacteraceae bacterium]|jgi:tRNA (cytidine/uridine-2'-O-)-methyltransferase|nr:tRNA (cytidine(34)-2'-O)-methyltransferase [Helicobacteraceae bacterium]
MFEIVLLSPKIPQNVGAIGRTCVCVGAKLSVIAPTPIDFSDKKLRRAGLDYWRYLDFRLWESLDAFLAQNPIGDRDFFFTTKVDRPYFDAAFNAGDRLWFGGEDTGLPENFWRAHSERALTMPMKTGFRSLNLANAVSVAIYEGVRQNYAEFCSER